MIVFKDTAENAMREIGYISQMNMRFPVELSRIYKIETENGWKKRIYSDGMLFYSTPTISVAT